MQFVLCRHALDRTTSCPKVFSAPENRRNHPTRHLQIFNDNKIHPDRTVDADDQFHFNVRRFARPGNIVNARRNRLTVFHHFPNLSRRLGHPRNNRTFRHKDDRVFRQKVDRPAPVFIAKYDGCARFGKRNLTDGNAAFSGIGSFNILLSQRIIPLENVDIFSRQLFF